MMESMKDHPPSQLDDWTFRRVMWATLVLVFVALSFWLLYRFNQVIFILFIAIILGTLIRPAVTWLHRRGLSRIVGIILIYFLILALFAGFFFLLFPLIAGQGQTIAAAVPGYYQNLRVWMGSFPDGLIAQLSGFLPETLFGQAPVQQTGEQLLASAGQALGYLSSAAGILFIGIAILLLAFYWTLDGPRTIRSLLLLVPMEHRDSTRDLIASMEIKVGSYVAGEGILCLVIGVMALVAYLIIGLPYALILALMAGLFEAVPLVGPLLGAIPAGIVALSIAPGKLVWVIVATVFIQQLENALLVPRVMHKAVGVNPFVSLLAIFAFSSLLGFPGALMAIPMAAIIQLILDRFVFDPGGIEPKVPASRNYASRLRYEAQDLAQGLRKQARLKKGGSDRRITQIDQVMDEIETITTDLDALLAEASAADTP
jgi:predicted PurR-regulated permease PerM